MVSCYFILIKFANLNKILQIKNTYKAYRCCKKVRTMPTILAIFHIGKVLKVVADIFCVSEACHEKDMKENYSNNHIVRMLMSL